MIEPVSNLQQIVKSETWEVRNHRLKIQDDSHSILDSETEKSHQNRDSVTHHQGFRDF